MSDAADTLSAAPLESADSLGDTPSCRNKAGETSTTFMPEDGTPPKERPPKLGGRCCFKSSKGGDQKVKATSKDRP